MLDCWQRATGYQVPGMGEPSVSTLVGYFLQDEQGTDASTFEYVSA